MDLIKIAEEAFATKKEYPSFKSGDTITVAYRIKEGNKERISTEALLSVSQDMVTKNVLLFVRCLRTLV
jgi:large subunit ribosomal protein L19